MASNEQEEMAVAIGIDLGTTYSCVGVVQHGKVEIIANDHGQRTTASCVAFTNTERLVGAAAKSQEVSNPTNTIFAVKRLMGRNFSDVQVQQDVKLWPFCVAADERGVAQMSVQFKYQKLVQSPIQISAMILAKMKSTAEAYLGRKVSHAVITVPAYFNDGQREATKIAGEIAELQVLRIINEPAAAALAFAHGRRVHGKVLVFDLGGGTFDVSILEDNDGVFQVLAHDGNEHLGGEDFDNRLVQHFVDEYRRKTGRDVSTNQRAMRRLRSACELAKRTLSTLSQADVEIDCFAMGEDLKETVSRARFEDLNEALFLATLEPVRQVLKMAQLHRNDIEEIVLVGGSTRIPKIQTLLSDFFYGKTLNKSINADEAVAYGAAIQAALLIGDSVKDGCHLLVDRTPLTLGLANEMDEMEEFIMRNSIIPAQVTHTFTTTTDNQTSILFEVYQGERRLVKDNILLGAFELKGIPPAPKEVPSIQVTFSVDCDSILHCSAVDQATGKSKKIVIRSKGKLSRQQIDAMIEQGRQNREEDEREARRIRARNQLEEYCFKIMQTLLVTPSTTDQWRDSDSSGDDDDKPKTDVKLVDKSHILSHCQNVTRWLQDNALADTEEFDYQMSTTAKLYNPFIKRVYKMTSVRFKYSM